MLSNKKIGEWRYSDIDEDEVSQGFPVDWTYYAWNAKKRKWNQ